MTWWTTLRSQHAGLLGAGAVFLISGLVYSQYGFDGELVKDDAVFAYRGQQLANGVAPYLSVFEPKGPIASWLAGLAVAGARAAGVDEILGMRLVFTIVSCLTVVAVLGLTTELFRSRRTGFVAAMVLLGFWGFARHSAAGPSGKTILMLPEVLSLLLAMHGQWFWAAVAASVGFLVWQPLGAYLVLVITLAWLQSPAGPARRRALASAVGGGLLPVALTALVFVFTGGLHEFYIDTIAFPFVYLDRPDVSAINHFLNPIRAVYRGYASMVVPFWLGALALAPLLAKRLRYSGGPRAWLLADPAAVVFLSLPPLLVLTMLDFQNYPDLYIFLPYVSLGFAWLLDVALGVVITAAGGSSRTTSLAVVTAGLVLAASAAGDYRRTNDTLLVQQRAWAMRLQELLDRRPGRQLVAIGRPEALVLLGRTNPSRFVYIGSGEHNVIEDTYGGIEAWLEATVPGENAIVVLGRMDPIEVEATVVAWLESNEFTSRSIGPWMVYVP